MFFKSLHGRLIIIFTLLVISIMIVVGTYLIYEVENTYYKSFRDEMKLAFDNFSSVQITGTNIKYDSPEYTGELYKVFKNYFAINNINRKAYILDDLGNIIQPETDIANKEILPITPNIRNAMNKQIGDSISKEQYLDFAKPIIIDGKVKYILYIKQNKQAIEDVVLGLKKVIFYSVFCSFLISLVLAYLVSKAITIPIYQLTNNAQKMASGNFEQIVSNNSDDEIGKLTDTFNYMAKELKRTLNEISSEKSKIETLLLHMNDGVIAFSNEGTIIHANPAAVKMLGITSNDETFTTIFSRLNINVSLEKIIYLQEWTNINQQVNFNNKYLKIFFAPFKDESNKVNGVICVAQDITEQEKLENMRREFVANVSHELKTPLTSIRSYSETMLEDELDPEMRKSFMQVINTEANRMARLVSDLLQLSRLDFKQDKWNKQYFDVAKLVKEISQRMDLEAKKKKQNLECLITSEVPQVYADKDGIEQVILNIISNAIKYTQEEGKINVYVGFIHDSAYIKVIDTGIGIPSEDLERVFERFYRVDKARSREMGGTGLGLAIAKEIVEANDGTIKLNSEYGKGTEVILTLLVKPSKKENIDSGNDENESRGQEV